MTASGQVAISAIQPPNASQTAAPTQPRGLSPVKVEIRYTRPYSMSSAVAAAKARRSERRNICTRHNVPVAHQATAQTSSGGDGGEHGVTRGRALAGRSESQGGGDG
ncbi:hypothetical protein GCM10020220_101110 [Nonomuraea rubra]